jgi:hypothetical protein
VALVDAPSALAGFQLVLRLPRSRSQNKQDRTGRWVVHVPLSGRDAVRKLLKDVQLWLREEQIAETRVRVGDDVHRVRLGDDDGARSAQRDSTTEGNP